LDTSGYRLENSKQEVQRDQEHPEHLHWPEYSTILLVMGYTIAEAANLLGISADAVRKRLSRGELSFVNASQSTLLDKQQVDSERASLLQRLGATEQGASPEYVLLLQSTVERLTDEVRKLRTSMHSLVLAGKAQNESQNAVWDTVSQLTLPDDATAAESRR
jgi:excisionase family DNA binding protein